MGLKFVGRDYFFLVGIVGIDEKLMEITIAVTDL